MAVRAEWSDRHGLRLDDYPAYSTSSSFWRFGLGVSVTIWLKAVMDSSLNFLRVELLEIAVVDCNNADLPCPAHSRNSSRLKTLYEVEWYKFEESCIS